MARFPRIAPHSRVFTPGRSNYKAFRAMNGAVTRIHSGKTLTDSEMTLKFTALHWDKAHEIHDHYELCELTGASIGFDDNHPCTRDAGTSREWMNKQPGLRWYFSEPPVFTARTTKLVDVSVKLIGELRS